VIRFGYGDVHLPHHGLGDSIEEAKASILEAMRLYIEECRATHRPIPRARTVYMETVSLAV
jgi:predicted RNase H-like HicB family nuclease